MPISTHKSKSNPWTWSTSPSKRCFVSTLPPILSWGIFTATGVSQFLTQEHATRHRQPRVLLAGALVGAAVPSPRIPVPTVKVRGIRNGKVLERPSGTTNHATSFLRYFPLSHYSVRPVVRLRTWHRPQRSGSPAWVLLPYARD